MSDSARKRTLADWVVKTKKQVVKLYAITKWARDAETVQKCMASNVFNQVFTLHGHLLQNITAFLMNQNQQFEDVMSSLTYAKENLDPARYECCTSSCLYSCVPFHRLRNHDLLTSLDVLTTGTYQRLPSGIKVLLFVAIT